MKSSGYPPTKDVEDSRPYKECTFVYMDHRLERFKTEMQVDAPPSWKFPRRCLGFNQGTVHFNIQYIMDAQRKCFRALSTLSQEMKRRRLNCRELMAMMMCMSCVNDTSIKCFVCVNYCRFFCMTHLLNCRELAAL